MTTYQELIRNEYIKLYATNYFKIDEGSGTTLNDSKGSAVGTISGATWLQNGGLSFDGTNDWVGFNESLNNLSEYTIKMTIKLENQTSTNQTRIFSTTHNTNGIVLAFNSDINLLSFYVWIGSSVYGVANVTIDDIGKVYDVQLVYSGKDSTYKIAIDDTVYERVLTNANNIHSSNIFVGTSNEKNSAQYFKGLFYEITIFNKDLIERRLNKTLILHEGEYKKFEEYDYSKKLDTTVSASSKLINYFKFDETSGNVTDSKGSIIGTPYNTPTRVTGWNSEGYAMSFNGSNQYILFNNKAIPTSKFSIKFKLQLEEQGRSQYIFSTNQNDVSSNNSGVLLTQTTSNELRFSISTNGSNSVLIFTSPLDLNKWYDILITWDGTINDSNVKMYIDDMFAPIVTGKHVTSSITHYRNLVMGNVVNGTIPTPNLFFKGKIDNFEVFNDVLETKDLFHRANQDGWKDISSTLPIQDQFLSDGMDSLSPLLDRRVETLDPQPMTDKSEILKGEEGKVFSKTLDLKKYMDIRQIKVEVE